MKKKKSPLQVSAKSSVLIPLVHIGGKTISEQSQILYLSSNTYGSYIISLNQVIHGLCIIFQDD